MVSRSYAIRDGRLHRQETPGGDWTMLDDDETARCLAALSQPALPSFAMVEAAAIALFDHDEDLNVAFVAACDAEGNRAPGDAMGRERDRWENHGNELQAAFRRRALDALTAAFALLRLPTAEARLPTAVSTLLAAYPGDSVIEPGETPGADGADMFHHPE